jgi:spermidine synthase
MFFSAFRIYANRCMLAERFPLSGASFETQEHVVQCPHLSPAMRIDECEHVSRSIPFLMLTVFVAGMSTLGLEMAASRLLDPFFGNSIVIWANLIGLVLIYLAVGYWLGGRWADRDPRDSTLYQIIGWAAFAIGVIPFISTPILRWSVVGFANFNAGILLGSFLGVLILFVAPMTLLGCVSPFAIRLAIRDVDRSGKIAGTIYAVSTIGSILGTFLPVLFLIPNIGTRRTFLFFSIALLVLSIVGLWRSSRSRAYLFVGLFLLVVIAGVLGTGGSIRTDEHTVFETESTYNYIRVIEREGEYWLRLNDGVGVHSVYDPETELTYGIWDYFLMAPYFNAPPHVAEDVDSLLLIGLAAGTVSRQYSAVYGDIPIDGIEIDPEIIEVGRQWFAMDQPNLNAVAADGRYFLANSDRFYDVIGVDAYRPPYIPFHLTTVEFFESAAAHLTTDGVIVVNVARTETDYSLVDALASTMKVVFPSVYVLDEPGFGAFTGNSLVVGTMLPTEPDNLLENISLMDNPLLRDVATRTMAAHLWEVVCVSGDAWRMANEVTTFSPVSSCAQPLTDDRAPIEQIVHRLILHYITGS